MYIKMSVLVMALALAASHFQIFFNPQKICLFQLNSKNISMPHTKYIQWIDANLGFWRSHLAESSNSLCISANRIRNTCYGHLTLLFIVCFVFRWWNLFSQLSCGRNVCQQTKCWPRKNDNAHMKCPKPIKTVFPRKFACITRLILSRVRLEFKCTWKRN